MSIVNNASIHPSVDVSQRELLIEARSVSYRIGNRQILDSVDIAVNRGEIVTLIGTNGAGKSTLIRVLLKLIKPDQGSVIQHPGLRVGYSPQHVHRDSILPLTVRHFLALGESISLDQIRELLEEVGVGNILAQPLTGISGGELHRVMLARALLRKPDLLVLDEPMAGVDAASQSELYSLIGDIRDRYGCGILLVSHDLYMVMADTDTVVCLNHHVCCTGHPQTVITHPGFISVFGKDLSNTLAIYSHSHNHDHSNPRPDPEIPDRPS
ncbi:MAG: metal ABC transporter ATP-binding protein [Gammaproteobacteria bacterium]|nr:metal ABC transporter ATP-binding protein [Gammaproteobacteria bacterium]MCY4313633.1 metal ABC transporter ATP-binding protein [Gammaproteobacteria bacterium]